MSNIIEPSLRDAIDNFIYSLHILNNLGVTTIIFSDNLLDEHINLNYYLPINKIECLDEETITLFLTKE